MALTPVRLAAGGGMSMILRNQMRAYVSTLVFLLLLSSCLCAQLSSRRIDTVSLFRKAEPSVALVLALGRDGQPFSQGSGFIVNGPVVVTNYHVIAGAEAVDVKISSGQTFHVTAALRINEKTDIAILQINAERPTRPFVPLELGDSSVVRIGEKVVAIGSPQGLENTISEGIVSGIRELGDELSYIQTTAPISPGSSGGPLLNADGDVIGITTFLVRGGQSLNFCVPINYVKAMLRDPKPIHLSALRAKKYSDVLDLTGLWSYDTFCKSCKPQRASGTIRILASEGHFVVDGHITYTDGSEFTWTELAYTDGRTIWGYAVNDRGQVGIHIYQVEEGQMTSTWSMSNGASGVAVSNKER